MKMIITAPRGKMAGLIVADACGVTQKTISALEVDRRNPSYELLLRLTKALDVTPNQLIGDDPHDEGRA